MIYMYIYILYLCMRCYILYLLCFILWFLPSPGLLAARLFQPDQVHGLMEEFRSSALCKFGHHEQIHAVCEADVSNLQRYVRTQFLCIPKNKWPKPLQFFIETAVMPCLQVPAGLWNAQIVVNAGTIAEKLKSRQLSSLEDVNLKLACHVASGTLDQHPVIQGILVAAVEQAQRAKRGTSGMKHLCCSEVELELMAEAGTSLALAANNLALVREFGLAFAVPKLPLANLHGQNLPVPGLLNLRYLGNFGRFFCTLQDFIDAENFQNLINVLHVVFHSSQCSQPESTCIPGTILSLGRQNNPEDKCYADRELAHPAAPT